MTHRVGPKGQVVIPKPMRDELGLQPGDEVTFEQLDDHVVVRRARGAAPLRGRFRGKRLSDELARDRRAERARDASR